ncbi:MAG TPA: His/Gly/Thr/Pro-type tRNA ligase C-terminal domain-containing protein [Actinomadura sp.]|jgi:prolyl-tRNA synthetase|nr:His/Gly/Thr/Pro-type tRNA ligase C-terminal domain-containing protein [Actinomadura sp.]
MPRPRAWREERLWEKRIAAARQCDRDLNRTPHLAGRPDLVKGYIGPQGLPADVHIVATGKDGQISAALQPAGELEERGLRVLVDDRSGVSAGVKSTDAELVGVPTIPVVGRGFGEGILELRDRRTGERGEIGIDRIIGHLTGMS